MKLSEIARYWAAKELTTISVNGNKITLNAPFASHGFALKINFSARNPAIRTGRDEIKQLIRVKDLKELKSNTWYAEKSDSILCFNLEKGLSELTV
jgi:hypothetical protein